MGFKKKFLKFVKGSQSSGATDQLQYAAGTDPQPLQTPRERPPPAPAVAATTLEAEQHQRLEAAFLGVDPLQAASSAEQLFAAASASRKLCIQLCNDVRFLRGLSSNLQQTEEAPQGAYSSPSSGSRSSTTTAEKLQAYAAYLASALAGASAASDALLVDSGLVGALLQLLHGSRSWAAKKGALRALAKLLPSPDASAQLVAGGGLSCVTALLDSDDQGIIRRCLSILVHACSSASAQAHAAMGDVVASGGLGPLVRLAECRSAEVQAEAVEALKLLCRLPETGALLADMGGIEVLARIVEEGQTQATKAAARVGLHRVLESAQQRPEGRHVLRALHAAGYYGAQVPSEGLPGGPCGGPCCSPHLAAYAATTPPTHKHSYAQGGPTGSLHSPSGVLSPPGSGNTSTAFSACGSLGRASVGQDQYQSGQRAPWGQDSAAGLAQRLSACSLGSSSSTGASRPEQHCRFLHGAAARPHPGQSAEASSSLGTSSSTGEARDHFNAESMPSSLMGADQGWMLQRTDITICLDQNGREVRLGEGGFGTVLKAVMCGVDEVAVKRIRADTPTASDLAVFTKEVAVLRCLHHRNIVQFYGACLEPGSLFFVTELMKGGDLYRALRRNPAALAWGSLARKVALDIALGLHYLHSRRPPMMHRDLKSPNVCLTEEGVAKLADVAMVRSQAAELVTAQPVLTPLWAAPEVLRRERASVKADIWSYGVLIWEIVTGADIVQYQPLALTRQMQQFPPVTSNSSGGETSTSKDAKKPSEGGDHGRDNGALLMELPPGCPRVAAHIFQQCTQLDPSQRPSAAQLVEWLRSDAA